MELCGDNSVSSIVLSLLYILLRLSVILILADHSELTLQICGYNIISVLLQNISSYVCTCKHTVCSRKNTIYFMNDKTLLQMGNINANGLLLLS